MGPFLWRQPLSGADVAEDERLIYWLAPSEIIGFLFLGFVSALAHHLFASSRHGRVVASTDEQELYIRICTVLALLTRTLLTVVVITSYIQQQWLVFKTQSKSVYHIDGLFAVLHDTFAFRRLSMWSKNWVLLFLASLKWLLVIPTIFTPATLSVELAPSIQTIISSVPTLNFASPDWTQNDHPHPIVQSLTLSSATGGDILSITPPATNCSYSMKFTSPALRCQEVKNVTTFPNPPGYSGWFNALYFSWAGEFDSWNSSETVLRNPLGHSNARSALSIWIAAKPKVVGCVLYNASYSTSFEFETGKQFVKSSVDQYLNRIPFTPSNGAPTPNYLENRAYQHLMTTLGQTLVGQVAKDGLAGYTSETYTSTLILATKLGLDNATNERMLEQLFTNMTLSVLHSNHVQKSADTAQKVDVTVRTIQNVYHYNSKWLFLSYGLGFGFTVISAIIGGSAIYRNKASYSNDFSTILRVTRGPVFDELVAPGDRQGQDPLPNHIREKEVRLISDAERAS